MYKYIGVGVVHQTGAPLITKGPPVLCTYIQALDMIPSLMCCVRDKLVLLLQKKKRHLFHLGKVGGGDAEARRVGGDVPFPHWFIRSPSPPSFAIISPPSFEYPA